MFSFPFEEFFNWKNWTEWICKLLNFVEEMFVIDSKSIYPLYMIIIQYNHIMLG